MITVNSSMVTPMTVKGGGKTYHWDWRHLIRSRIRQVTFLLNA